VVDRISPLAKRGGLTPELDYDLYVGIDAAMKAHEVCVLRSDRSVVGERSVPHTGSGIEGLINWLLQLSQAGPDRVAAALESPHGALAEALMEHGFHLYSINPKQLDRFRDRHTVAGAKDDRRDAFVLADSLRTDRPCFRRLQIDEPLMIQLREVSRIEEELNQEARRLANRLHAQVYRLHPGVLQLCPAADEAWFWELLELIPTPQQAARLRPGLIDKLLRKHRIRRLSAREVTAQLREPVPPVAPGTIEAARAHIDVLLPQLRVVQTQRRKCQNQIERFLEELASSGTAEGQKTEHHDVQVLRSLPGVGRVVAATMLAEASRALVDRDHPALRAHAGIAPVTRRSGKTKIVVMRYACNTRLRNALYHAARVAVQKDSASRALYAAQRARGHGHARALRSVADRLLRILFAMLRTRTLYDDRHVRRVPPGEVRRSKAA